MAIDKRGGKKGRKIGRNKAKCAAYEASGRREARKASHKARCRMLHDKRLAREAADREHRRLQLETLGVKVVS